MYSLKGRSALNQITTRKKLWIYKEWQVREIMRQFTLIIKLSLCVVRIFKVLSKVCWHIFILIIWNKVILLIANQQRLWNVSVWIKLLFYILSNKEKQLSFVGEILFNKNSSETLCMNAFLSLKFNILIISIKPGI